MRAADLATLAAAVWLICAPYVLNYTGTGRLDGFWSDPVTGAVLGLAALVRLADPDRAVLVRWASLLLGGWLVAAPFLLGYGAGSAPRATANEIAVGAVVAILAGVSLRAAACRGRRADRPR
ncbi:MAG TPA: SPW repeat protein [Mycobacteriales bacterium]